MISGLFGWVSGLSMNVCGFKFEFQCWWVLGSSLIMKMKMIRSDGYTEGDGLKGFSTGLRFEMGVLG